MAKLFRGRYESKLDSKGRLSLPSQFRESDLSSSHTLVITNSLYKGLRCLDVYSLSAWEQLESKIRSLASLKSEVQAFQRFYLSSGQVVDVDSQGRFVIPQSLRQYLGVESEVMLVGMGEKFEIWSTSNWNKLNDSLMESFDHTLAVISNMQVGV